MLRITDIKLSLEESEQDLFLRVCKMLGETPKKMNIVKKSIDARKKSDIRIVYAVDVEVADESRVKLKNARRITPEVYVFPKGKIPKTPVVIAGAGPAGLMCGLTLSKNGYKVIILERGKCVEERIKDVEHFWETGALDTESNVQFGEGGAGTFSDGKLVTGVNDFRIRKVLEEFHAHGAPDEILYEARPHIGTDKLCQMTRNIRGDIIKHGGEVRFSNKLTGFIIKNGKASGVTVSSPEGDYEIETEHIVLAIGHSARDTFVMLKDSGFDMERKSFSIGARIEHPQELINISQYGASYTKLGAADYKLSVHLESGRSVYTFCMCPGGVVVASASEEGGVVTNGMSNFSRDGKNANSALLVGVNPDDFDGDDVLAGMYLQRKIERKAFLAAGSSYRAPAARVGDFLGIGGVTGAIDPTYRPGVVWTELDGIFPEFITTSMREALPILDRKLHGFAHPDAVLTAPETRSSSPVRIIRASETMQSNIKNVYPCGEGAGYAGGITTAAVDGMRIAEIISKTSL